MPRELNFNMQYLGQGYFIIFWSKNGSPSLQRNMLFLFDAKNRLIEVAEASLSSTM